MDDEKIDFLADKLIQGTIGSDELAELEEWYATFDNLEQEVRSDLNKKALAERLFRLISERAGLGIQLHRISKLWFRLAAAAIVSITIGAGYYLYTDYFRPGQIEYANDIAPGGNKAFLILNNGKKISLTDALKGSVAAQAGVEISKTKDGQLVYSAAAGKTAAGTAGNNTFLTPRGGQYQVILPEGSKVMLNASSSLTYPVNIGASGKREVTLDGEAYFEVAKDKTRPFIVHTRQMNVEVLGTHFNINSYTDEETVNTTLLEGSVKISGDGLNNLLKPGEQATLSTGTGRINIHPADTESVMAWKKGDFVFRKERLSDIMRRLSRWYDIDIVYEPDAPVAITLGGWVSQTKNISAVLKIMELTGKVHFKVEGRRVTVMK
ncbi:MAG TPA: FecR domain-containing protein [Pedobacter sp.]